LNFSEYFDRVYIIHLPERRDRYTALGAELARLGIDIEDRRQVRIPHAPRPADANQFPSRGVYGNFLSHLSILKEAQAEWVQRLQTTPWDLCFFGHSLKRELAGRERGLIPHTAGFIWAHCYAVNGPALGELIAYLELTAERPIGHPLGGRMYIDGAFTMFRQQHPHRITLVSNPVLSVQKGSPSNIAGTGWYRALGPLQPLLGAARALRDQWWRLTA